MIKEIASAIMKDIKQSAIENLEKFKSSEGLSLPEAKSIADTMLKEAEDPYYTDLSDRIGRTPLDSENGHWDGERGESKYIPSEETELGRAGKEKLAEYGLDGIQYKDGFPDYSECNEGTVKIDHMTENRNDYTDDAGNYQQGNFSQADTKLSEKWNEEKRDGKSDWTASDVREFRRENELSWHECGDMETMNLVSRDIHGGATSVFLHSGGVAECKIRDSLGGGFDE